MTIHVLTVLEYFNTDFIILHKLKIILLHHFKFVSALLISIDVFAVFNSV